MRLVDAIRYFDNTVVRDAYTNVALFNAQTSNFIESQVDGTTANKRIMSCAFDVSIPTRRVLRYAGEQWIVGNGITDVFQNVKVRSSYISKKATGLYNVLTPSEMALDTDGTTAYGQLDYLKSTVNGPTDSEYDSQYEFSFSTSETMVKGNFLRIDTKIYHVRNVHDVTEGFIVCEADSVDGTLEAVTLSQGGAYNPVTDVYGTTSVVTTGLLVDRYKLYALQTQADTLNRAGDMTLVLSNTITPVIGMAISASGSWRVEGFVPYLDAYLVHLRRA